MASYVQGSVVVAAWAIAAAWSVQAVTAARGLRGVQRLAPDQSPAAPPPESSVAVIVPACNEQESIIACLQSLLDQQWPNLHIVAVDDRSSDHTGELMNELAARHPDRLSVLHVTTLPPRWMGKTHAMALGARHAQALLQPRWLLFTDGDVLFAPECLQRSLALAEAQGADHFVTAPTAVVETPGEAMMMAFLQVIGLWGARLWRVADPATRDAVGIGAFNLMRTSSFERLGGFESLRLQVLEDLALARLVKNSGMRQRIALAPQCVRVHWASGVWGVLHTMTKNLFAIFRFRLGSVFAACCGLLIFCLGPIAGLFWAPTRVPSLLAALAIVSLYRTAASNLSPFSPVYALAFPLSAILFVYAIGRSCAVTLFEGGVRWRGTLYPLRELRAAAMKLR